MTRVSVVVPVLDARRTLPACLDALGALSPAPDEIVLVDNGSRDGSRELLARFAASASVKVTVLDEPRRGAAAARNHGIGAATGDIVAFTDADCVPEPPWLAALVAPFADATVGAVAGRIVAAPTASLVETFSGLYTLQSPDAAARYARWTPWSGGFATANLAVRREVLAAIGGFDTDLAVSGEDHDLCARIYAAGHVLAYVPAARVAHRHRAGVGALARQAFGFGRAHPCLLRRHASGAVWLELPRVRTHGRAPVTAWVDLASADKKVALLGVLGVVSTPMLAVLGLYGVWLVFDARRRAKRRGTPVSARAAAGLAALLVVKSGAMTAGRWWGSLRDHAVCV